MHRLRVPERVKSATAEGHPMINLRGVRMISIVCAWRIERFMAKRTPTALSKP